jgi:hypothetical protein
MHVDRMGSEFVTNECIVLLSDAGRANMRGMLFEGAVRDLAKSFDDLELRRERMGQRNVSGSREDMRRAEIICSGVGGIVGIVEGGRESWRIDPLVAARIHDLLNVSLPLPPSFQFFRVPFHLLIFYHSPYLVSLMNSGPNPKPLV